MPTKFKKRHIKVLLERLSSKSGEPLSFYGFENISDAINGTISKKYLYDSLFRPTKNIKNEDEVLNLDPSKIDEIVQFLGYHTFEQIRNEIDLPLSPVLLALKGSYYSYVRKNSKDGILFQSPVKIEQQQNNIILTLKGPNRTFSGVLNLNDGCLFCLIKTSDKSFYHVYNVGKVKGPKVIQGIFSGITSSNIPIGGRCILVYQEDSFENLTNSTLSTQELSKSNDKKLKSIASYFEKYEDNNLVIKNPITHDFNDLVDDH